MGGISVQPMDLLSTNHLSNINWESAANGPWFLLGIFIMFNALGLLFRARVAWAVSLILMLTSLIFSWHYFPQQQAALIVYGVTLAGLILLGKDFDHSSATAGGIFALISFTLLLIYGVYGSLYFGSYFKPQIENFTTALYFSIVTMTTVGYGDIVPINEAARLFTLSLIVAGITVFATSLTTVFAPIIHGGITKLIKGNQRIMTRKDHYIICGNSILALATVNQLLQKGFAVTVIDSETSNVSASLFEDSEQPIDTIYGDYTDEQVLNKAGIKHCRALMVMTNNDATNIFIVLSAKSYHPNAKVVVTVNNSKNINKVKSVNADVILSPSMFAGEILTSLVTNEPLDNDKLLNMLQASCMGFTLKS